MVPVGAGFVRGAATYCALHPCNLVSWLYRSGCTLCNPLLPGQPRYGARDVGEDFFWYFVHLRLYTANSSQPARHLIAGKGQIRENPVG